MSLLFASPLLLVWVLAGAVLVSIFLVIAVILEPQIFERPLRWLGRKRPAWHAASVLLDLHVDDQGAVTGAIYSGFVRNPGDRYETDILRRCERGDQARRDLVRAVTWETPIRFLAERGFQKKNGTIRFVGADRTIHCIDAESGASRWTVPFGADLRQPALVDAAGHLLLLLLDSTWLRIDADGGATIDGGTIESDEHAAALLRDTQPMFPCIDTERLVVGEAVVTLGSATPPHAEVFVETFDPSDVTGLESWSTSAARPPIGHHELSLSGRHALASRFVAYSDCLVLLTGVEPGASGLEVFAESLDLDSLHLTATIALGTGSAACSIDLAYTVGAFLAIRVTGIQGDAGPAGTVTFVLDMGRQRVVTRLPRLDSGAL